MALISTSSHDAAALFKSKWNCRHSYGNSLRIAGMLTEKALKRFSN
jgi:hypothetical protein